MNVTIRVAGSLPLAFLATAALFLMLALLIAQNQDLMFEDSDPFVITVIRQIDDSKSYERAPTPRPVLNVSPPEAPVLSSESFRATLNPGFSEGVEFSGEGVTIGPAAGPGFDAQPIVRPPPQYPTQCQGRANALETVVVEFDVTPQGTVNNPRVVSSSNACFNRAAMQSVARWRYQPRLVDNEPQPRFGLRTAIDFRLEN